jgi:hypothetical protein
MERFYFKVIAVNQDTYAYRVEAPGQRTADASIAAYPGARKWERIEEKRIPTDMTFRPFQEAPAVWQGERRTRLTDPLKSTSEYFKGIYAELANPKAETNTLRLMEGAICLAGPTDKAKSLVRKMLYLCGPYTKFTSSQVEGEETVEYIHIQDPDSFRKWLTTEQ